MKDLRELVEKWRSENAEHLAKAEEYFEAGDLRIELWSLGAAHAAEGCRGDLAGVLDTLGWQPIETAPKDGTRVLLWAPGSDVEAWTWDAGMDRWGLDSSRFDTPYWTDGGRFGPTKWHALPEPPEAP